MDGAMHSPGRQNQTACDHQLIKGPLFLLVLIAGLATGCERQVDIALSGAALKVSAVNSTPLKQVVDAAIEQTRYTRGYDPSYVRIDYPNGDVPIETGVCSDVIVRAFRKIGVDLQKEIHEDMKRNFSAYPKSWGLAKPDPNIDHRRVPNLMTYFKRQGKQVAITTRQADYLPADIVAWRLNNGLLHIGIVTDIQVEGTSRYKIAHNIGAGAQVEDVLFSWKVIGHYRYFRDQH
ncbi:MAG TPA: DUF1287 domain-containing protein [Blastocatellia bacterium]